MSELLPQMRSYVGCAIHLLVKYEYSYKFNSFENHSNNYIDKRAHFIQSNKISFSLRNFAFINITVKQMNALNILSITQAVVTFSLATP